MPSDVALVAAAVVIEAHLATAVVFIVKMHVRQRITEERVRLIAARLGLPEWSTNDLAE